MRRTACGARSARRAAPARATAGQATSRCCGAPRGPTGRRSRLARTLWLAVAGLLEAAGPLFGKQFIDDYLLPRALDWTMMALLVAGYLVTGCRGDDHPLLPARAPRRPRDALGAAAARGVYGHVLRLPMAFFDRAITGQLVSRITNDTEAVKQLYTQVLFEVLVGLTVLFGVVVAMLWLDWRLMLLVLLLVPATIGIVWGYQRLSAGPVARSRALRSDINAQMAEGIAGMSVLQAMGAARALRRPLRADQRRALRGADGRGARQRVAAAPGARLPQHPADRDPSSPPSAPTGRRASRSDCCTRSSPTSRASSSR